MLHIKQKAFTLVELIVVVTILAILATIGFVSYSSYLTGVRDTNRLAQLVSIHDGLELYRTGKDLPLPDESVEVQTNGEIIAYQGYAGSNTLETIDFTKGGKDPRDGEYFSYYLTDDRKYFQLMGFLEEDTNVTSSLYEGGKISLLSKTQAVDYSGRIPTVYGRKLGILTDTSNTPIQDLGVDVDISNTADIFRAYLSGDDLLEGDSTVLSVVEDMAKVGGRGYSIENDIIVYVNPDTGIPRDGLVAEYLFENNFNDYSGYQNHGVMANGVFVDGKIGNAFDANSGNLIVPDSESIDIATGEFAISVWFKMDTELSLMSSAYPQFVLKRPWLLGGYGLYFGKSSDTLLVQYCYDGGSKTTSMESLSPDIYYHLVGNYNGEVLQIFIDGKNVVETASTIPMESSTGTDLLIGVGFEGEIDNLRIYDRALSTSEVDKLFSETN